MDFAIYQWIVMRQGIETIKPGIHVRRFVESVIGHGEVSDRELIITLESAAEDGQAIWENRLEVARKFRKEPTRSEALLWEALGAKKLDGWKFRRQQPMGPFILDFSNP